MIGTPMVARYIGLNNPQSAMVFGGLRAVDHVNLHIDDGEIVACCGMFDGGGLMAVQLGNVALLERGAKRGV